jgi:hypothetical protein
MRMLRLVALALVATGAASLWGCAPKAPWTEATYPAWGFAVSFPAAPKIGDHPATAENNQVHSFSAESRYGGVYLAAIVMDASHTDKGADQIMSEVGQAMAKGGTLTQTYTATGKVMGREIRIEKPGEVAIRMRLFVANRRLYEIGGQSPLGAKDERITRFMDSFRLLAEPSAAL